jgi:hypothetical protein
MFAYSTATQKNFPDRLRLPLRFDAARLERDLHAAERQAWTPHFVPDNYAGDWSAIPLRSTAGATHPIMMIYSDPSCRDFVDAPILESCPAFKEALAAFACPVLSARLMRLGPGSLIREHRDHDLSFEQGVARLHIPVATNPDVVFSLNGAPVALEAGSCWYLRLSDPHSVVNGGASARVHLVIDVLVDAWLESRFLRAMELDEEKSPAHQTTGE